MDPLRELVLPRLQAVKKSGAGFSARCPAHDDHRASLSISAGRDQPVVLHCHTESCDPDDILNAIGLTWEDLSKPRERQDDGEWTPAGPAIAVYDYRDENGTLLFQVLRTSAKDFRQRVPDPLAKSGWTWRLGNVRRVPYRLQAVTAAVAEGREVWIVEGEKDVHTLVAQGIVATCNPGGAGKWRPEYADHFHEAIVTIVADRDEPGRAHARQVRDILTPVAACVRIVEVTAGKDVTDHVSAGRSLLDVEETFTTEQDTRTELAPDLWEFLATPEAPYDWIVPHLIERGDRLILTGFEGLGKSMLIRQMAVMIAAGLNPFHPAATDTEPQRVLFIDCENSIRQALRKFGPLAAASIKYGRRVPDGGLRLIHRPKGIDLTRDDDAEWLMERVRAHKPDVLFIGPFYRLHNAKMEDEMPARKVAAVLDAARVAAGCALISEAHSGHGDIVKGRSLRPAGSSLLLRWPEFGFGIRPEVNTRMLGQRPMDVAFDPWRGGRDDRRWPAHLTMGDPGDWPWRVSLGVPTKEGA